MKEITIRYNTYDKYHKDGQHIQVLIDGKPIEHLKRFSIELDTEEVEPLYTVQQYMDFPGTDDNYNGNNYYQGSESKE